MFSFKPLLCTAFCALICMVAPSAAAQDPSDPFVQEMEWIIGETHLVRALEYGAAAQRLAQALRQRYRCDRLDIGESCQLNEQDRQRTGLSTIILGHRPLNDPGGVGDFLDLGIRIERRDLLAKSLRSWLLREWLQARFFSHPVECPLSYNFPNPSPGLTELHVSLSTEAGGCDRPVRGMHFTVRFEQKKANN